MMTTKKTLVVLLGTTFLTAPAIAGWFEPTGDQYTVTTDLNLNSAGGVTIDNETYSVVGSGGSDGSAPTVSGNYTTNYLDIAIKVNKMTFDNLNVAQFKHDGYDGGVFFNNAKAETFAITNSKFTANGAKNGGVLYNRGYGYLGADDTYTNANISLIENNTFQNNFVNNGAGGVIYNAGTIGTISGNAFLENGAYDDGSLGGAIYNSGTITTLKNNTFSENKSPSGSGGAIYNAGTIHEISNSENYSFSKNTANKDGGALYNAENAVIDAITSNFDQNSTSSEGGAVYNAENATISSLTGNFSQNFVSSESGGSLTGGAIYNEGTIDGLKGNFDENYALSKSADSGKSALGGAIENAYTGTITKIEGNFTKNYAKASEASINTKTSGGAISNAGTIGSIIGDFTENYVSTAIGGEYPYNYASGGAVSNSRTIDEIIGNFTGNYAKIESRGSYDSQAFGGALLNDAIASIGSIKGDFTKNSAVAAGRYAYGGAIYNLGTLKTISGNFTQNTASADESALGGAIYNSGEIGEILNSSFYDNTVSGTDEAKGGAIFSESSLNIVADNDTSTFRGNTANGESNAVYMRGGKTIDLNLTAQNSGTITFDDAIDGQNYNVNIKTDDTSYVILNNALSGVSTLSLAENSVLQLGKDAKLSVTDMTADKGATLSLDLKVDAENQTTTSGLIEVAGELSGEYSLIVNALTSDWYDGASTIFLKAENDTNSGNESFTVSRVTNSPYLWEAYRVTTTSSDDTTQEEDSKTDTDSTPETDQELNSDTEETVNLLSDEASADDATETTNGSTWALKISINDESNDGSEDDSEDDSKDDLNGNTSNYALTPEVVAAEALHEAAIEQTRTLARNVSARVMPNTYQAGDPLRRAWAYVEGTKSNIKKPIDVDGKIYGVDAGFDLQRDLNNAFGVFVSYRNGDYDVDGSKSKGIGSSIDIDSYLGGLYYRYNSGKFKGLALVYAGRQKADVKTDDRIASFDTKGLEFGAAGEIGYEFDLNRVWSLDPSVGLRYTQIDFDSASDNVGKKYDWDDVKYLEVEASLALTRHFTQGKLYVKPAVLQTLTSGDSVKVTGLDSTSTTKDMTLGRIEIGGRYDLTERLSGYGWAHYTAGSDYDATAAGLGLSYRW